MTDRQRMLDDLRRRNYSPTRSAAISEPYSSLRSTLGALQNNWGPQSYGAISFTCFTRGSSLSATVENNISALRFLYTKTLKRRDLAFDDLPFQAAAHVAHCSQSG